MIKNSYPSLRVAYIDEVEERDGDKVQKVYYSVLVKAVENRDQVRQRKSRQTREILDTRSLMLFFYLR